MGWGSGGYGSIGWGSAAPASSGSGLGPFRKVTETNDALRIVPANWIPVDGSFVLALGSDTPGRKFNFVDGDSIELSQIGDFEASRLLRMTTHIRGPEEMPAGTRWVAEILIDNVQYAEREILPGREKDLFDMGANVAHFTGNHEVAVRLRFEDTLATGDVFEVELPAWYLDDLQFLDA